MTLQFIIETIVYALNERRRARSSAYHTERTHQGLGSKIIMPAASPSNENGAPGEIQRRSRLGGLLNYYARSAA